VPVNTIRFNLCHFVVNSNAFFGIQFKVSFACLSVSQVSEGECIFSVYFFTNVVGLTFQSCGALSTKLFPEGC